MTNKRRANVYKVSSSYLGIAQDDMTVKVFAKTYFLEDDTQRGLITTPVYPCYISRKETAELLLQMRARSRGSIEGLTVTYTRITEYRD